MTSRLDDGGQGTQRDATGKAILIFFLKRAFARNGWSRTLFKKGRFAENGGIGGLCIIEGS
jgi:hypothetical protein